MKIHFSFHEFQFVTKHIQISEESLIALLVSRDMKGMGILYDNYSSALYGVIYRIIQNDEIAEDVLQIHS